MALLSHLESGSSPSLSLVLGFATVFILIQLGLLAKRACFGPLGNVPGPFYARWTNLVLKWKVITGQRSMYIHELHQKYGQYIRIAPEEVSVSNPHDFRVIYKAGSGFNKAPWYETFTDAGASPGMFAMLDPKAHANRRRLFAQQFSNSSVLKLEPVVKSKVEVAVAKIARDAQRGAADVLKWWTFFATDVIGQLSFGKSFDMLQKEERDTYMRDVETQFILSGMRTEMPPVWAILKILPIPALRHLLHSRDRIHEYGATAIRNHKEYMVQEKTDDEQDSTFFSRFLDPSKHVTELSDFDISSEAGNLIVAGSDTTANAAAWCTWALLRPRNAGVRKRLMEEVDTLPIDAAGKDILALPYLKAVIDEALRLYGIGPSLPRVVPEGGVVLGGYKFPPGLVVSSQTFTIHRDPNLFHDPERFWPERWENANKEMRDAFAPFGMGTRTCIGIHLALLELHLAIFRFMKVCPTAQLAASTTEKSMEFENFFILAPKGHKCEVSILPR